MTRLKRNAYSQLASASKTESQHSPQSLWLEALNYFKWVEDNPLKEEKVFSSGKKISVNKLRAMSTTGFCVFANLRKTVFEEYMTSEEYAEVISRIKDIIYVQKFEGAAAGLFETSFVARELGLKDQTDITTNGKDIHIEVIDKQTKKQLDTMHKKLSE